jgi:predicted transcriptional regulator
VFRKLLRDPFARDPLQTAFGTLEREVMDILWAEGNLAVRDVQARLRRPAAYTTVMTTLDRLFKKGILSREQSGRAFLYRPLVSTEELKASIASRVITGVLQGTGESAVPILSNLVDTVSAQDQGADLLRTLEEMVRDKRRRLEDDQSRSSS